MRVNTWKNIDVEVEVDVSIEEVLAECSQRVDEAAPAYTRRMIGALDTLTRILARVSDELIADIHVEGRKELHKRISTEAERYAEKSS